jgi:peptide/nickel transport system permease protein
VIDPREVLDGTAVAAEPADPLLRLARPRRAAGSVSVLLAVSWLTMLVLAAIFADLLPIRGFEKVVGDSATGPGFTREFLGTDQIGRSLVSRVVYGARASLAVSVGAVVIGAIVGCLMGLVSGFYKGAWDYIFSIVTNSILAFPALVLLMALAATVGTNLWTLIIGLAVLSVPTFARLARTNTAAYSEREFVLAARALGITNRRILFREILPNIVPVLLSYISLLLAVLIIAEGSLSFLGIGVPAPTPSWGGMISAGRQRLQDSPHVVFVPGAVMFLTVFALNVAGERLRARFDIGRTSRSRT